MSGKLSEQQSLRADELIAELRGRGCTLQAVVDALAAEGIDLARSAISERAQKLGARPPGRRGWRRSAPSATSAAPVLPPAAPRPVRGGNLADAVAASIRGEDDALDLLVEAARKAARAGADPLRLAVSFGHASTMFLQDAANGGLELTDDDGDEDDGDEDADGGAA